MKFAKGGSKASISSIQTYRARFRRRSGDRRGADLELGGAVRVEFGAA
jgi:hypothetical protein